MADHPNLSLPSLELITTSDTHPHSPLAFTLSLLLEPTPVLLQVLIPQLASRLALVRPLVSYTQLFDHAFEIIGNWDDTLRAEFVHGHPRIGEINILSKFSAQEQSTPNHMPTTGEADTPKEVLERLAFLNKCYEKRYPSLVYITFVNRRSRAQIRDELEKKLEEEGAIVSSEDELDNVEPEDTRGEKWKRELGRAINDIFQIAKSRLMKLGVQ